MSQKNDTPALILALLVTAGLLGGAIWLLSRIGINLGFLNNPNPNPTTLPATNSSVTQPNFSQVQNVPTGLFSYGGSTSWAPVRSIVDPAIRVSHPNFQLRYTNPITGTPGSASGIRMLINNQLAIAQSSRPLKPEEYQAAQQRGFTLKEIPVALEGIAIAVHPDLNVLGLTIEQLKGIYTGQITNWNQVGGPNLAIAPYSRRIADGGTVEFFQENVLDGSNFGNTTQYIGTTTEALRQVSANLGALYYASAPEVVGQCGIKPLPLGRSTNEWIPPYLPPLVSTNQCPAQRNRINADALQNGQYPLTRQLLVIIRQDGQATQQAGEAYANFLLTNQGQDLLSQAGFVRIR